VYAPGLAVSPSPRALPMLPGAEHLDFRCNGCGACCKALRVAITHHDLRRLVGGLGQPASTLVDWLAPDAVDMTGEPGSFVELTEGRRLMVLAQRGGACRLLEADRCSAYDHRPLDCRIFPLDLNRDAAGLVVGLARLPLDGCGDERGPRAELGEVEAEDASRWSELRDYQERLERWNRLVRHRRRFRRPVGSARDFLRWLGFDGSIGAAASGSVGAGPRE
jgi:Fe-S-cluster containining protein